MTEPFFLLGAQRSGTTMLRLMLNNHPGLAIPHETAFFTVFFERLADYGDLSQKQNAARLLDDISQYHLVVRGGLIQDKESILAYDIAGYSQLIDAIMTEYAHAQGKARWGDKTPFYTPDIDILWTLFPGAKFVHLVRDPRDVIVSQRKIEWLSDSVPRLAEDWRWKTTICSKVGSALGGEHYLELHYEDLVRDPEAHLKTICAFLGEPFDPLILSHHETAESIVPEHSLQWHRNSVRAPDVSKIGAWKRKLSRADRTIIEQVIGKEMAAFGYDPEGLPSSWSSRAKALYYYTVKRW